MLQNGHIYEIVNQDRSIRYIGSTIKALEQRWRQHVYDCGRGKAITIYKHMREHGIESFEMRLIKSYEIVDRAHLMVFETLYINKLKCVNRKASFNPMKSTSRFR